MTRKLEDFTLLNLGCGKDFRPDYWNVDIDPLVQADAYLNIFDWFPMDYEGRFYQVVAHDVLEHTSWFHSEEVLKIWSLLLAPKGHLIVRVPNIEAICHMVVSRELEPETACVLIYGGQNAGAENWRLGAHAAGFTASRLRDLAENVGLTVLTIERFGPTNLLMTAERS